MIIFGSICAVLFLLQLNFTSICGVNLRGSGLAIGLGVGLPFKCIRYPNEKRMQRLMKRHFSFDAAVKEIQPVPENKKYAKCPEDLRWANDVNDAPCNASFYEMSGLPESKEGKGNWAKLMGNTNMPKSNYFSAMARDSDFSINLVSSILTSQPSNGEISFNYWLSQPATFTVCLLHKASGYNDTAECGKPISGGKDYEANFPIKGPIDDSFKITIRSSNFKAKQGSFVVLNNIKYKSKFPDC